MKSATQQSSKQATFNAKGGIIFAGAMAISGSIGLFVNLIELNALNIVFFRCLIGVVCLGFYVLLAQRKGFKAILTDWPYILLGGLFLVFNWVFLFSAFIETSITVAVSIYYLAPIFIMIYGMLRGEAIGIVKVSSILLAFIGAIFVSGIGSSAPLNASLWGALYALLAALLYAGLVIVSKHISQTKSAHIAFLQTLIGTVVLASFVEISWQTLPDIRWDLLLLIGIVHTALMYILFFYGVKNTAVSLVALLGFIDPLIAVLLDKFVLDSVLTLWQWAGVLLILSAIVIKLRLERSPAPSANFKPQTADH